MDAAHDGKRVAFFGGTFDPPHLGHLAVARAARAALSLDAVLFAPVGAQPLKPQGASASFEDRLTMTRLAVAGEPGFEVSLIDAPRANFDATQDGRDSGQAGQPNGTPAKPNYTIDTLRMLRAVLPAEITLFHLMGADSCFSLRQWHRAAEIPFAAEMIVASRPGQPVGDLAAALPEGLALEELGNAERAGVAMILFAVRNAAGQRARMYLLPGLHVDISASAIRAALSEGRGGELVPAPVAEYIREHGLYGS